jgi:hypothetical protein
MNLPELLGPIENLTPTNSQRAVLWGPEILLMDSVEFFLKSANWEVVKLSSECGVDHLIQRVTMVKPAVIILCQERDASDFALLMQLAKVQFCLKVVVLSLESNLVQVYGKHNLIIHAVSDLLSVVES